MNKVIFIANSSWYLFNFRKNHIIKLIKRGTIVGVFAPFDEKTTELQKLGVDYTEWNLKAKSRNIFYELFSLASVFLYCFKEKDSIFLTFTPKGNIYTGLSCYLLRANYIANISGVGSFFNGSSFLGKIIKLLYKISLSGAKMTFFQNKDDMKDFIESNITKAVGSNVLPGSGVDIAYFEKNNDKFSSNKEHTYLLVSRLIQSKGILDFLELAKYFEKNNLPGKFILVGKEEANHPECITAETILQLSKNDNISIHLNQDDVKQFYKVANFCIFPTTYNEGTPKTLLESASMGCIPIVYKNKGFAQYLNNGKNGFQVLENNTRSIIDKIIEIHSIGNDELEKISNTSVKTIKKSFNDEIIFKKYDFYTNLQ